MLYINKITSLSTVDFAAEELKKYLRMMMPDGENVQIAYNPAATDGYRLGLMSDFDLDTSDAELLDLDDIIYLDCDTAGGIIAGSNPRSVLLAVYEYLKKNGCRWLFPGVDGEYIPLRDIIPVKHRHKASMRHRGNCIEGAVSQKILNDYVDFMPKVGLNTFMLQFRIPEVFYERFYNRSNVEEVSTKEPVTLETILQWTRLTECEMEKRGIMLHSYGHGLTADPFCPTPTHSGWETAEVSIISEGKRDFIAMMNGKRDFFRGMPSATNFCMSNPAARADAVKYITDYLAKHSNIDYLHIWLADGANNHCECEACSRMNPSDWYVTLLNELDESLTKKGIDTRIVFIAYYDTYWAPEHTAIKNKERFSLLFAPITRDYSFTVKGDENPTLLPYVRNSITVPRNLAGYLEYFKEWKKTWKGTNICFEYHFWLPMNYDISGIRIAERVFEDVAAYRERGFVGIIECGTQRCFFPHGLAFYTHARALFDDSLSFCEICDEYFNSAFGDAADEFKAHLLALEAAFPYEHFAKVMPNKATPAANFYSPELAKSLEKIAAIVESLKELIKKNAISKYRLRAASVRIMDFYAEYALGLSKIAIAKALGDNAEATRRFDEFLPKYVAFEPYLMSYVDMHQTVRVLKQLRDAKTEEGGKKGESEFW